MKRLTIDVWSDIACPWCYIGKRRLEAALQRFPARDQIALRWHAFELDPNAPRQSKPGSQAAELAAKYRTSVAQAEAMMQRVVAAAAKEGLDFRFDQLVRANTFDAHRVIAYAFATGGEALQAAVTERLMHAYFSEGAVLGDVETLVRLASEVGVDGDALRARLADGDFSDEVRADERRAQEAGISGVPCFVLDWKYGISGAQEADVMLQAITQAWDELPAESPTVEGAACTIDGCD